jgi:hypothetical protein
VPGFQVDVDDHGLAEKLALLGRKELRSAQKRGVTNAVKFGRATARGLAPVATGKGRRGVSYTVRSRGTEVVGKVYNKVFYMRFLARGTGDRYTKTSGAYRGRASDPFMERASGPTDAAAPVFIENSVGEALRAAGLV